ncbi:MAG: nuclear transport factor 2 family protein [Gemmatimonadaceae bacterium]
MLLKLTTAAMVAANLVAAVTARAQNVSALDSKFQSLVEARDAAIARGDTAAVHLMITDNLVWIDGSTGAVVTAPQLVGAVAHMQARSPSAMTDSVHARRVGDVVMVASVRVNRWTMGTEEARTTTRALDLFVLSGGKWLLASHTQVWIPAPPVPVVLDSTALAAFVGRYQLAPGFIDNVHRSGAGLVATATGEAGGAVLVPVSASVFRVANNIATVTIFERDSSGRVVGYVSHWPDGQVHRARKLE